MVGTYRILIIDDNPDESSVYGWYLGKIKDFKAELDFATSGLQGLKKLAEAAYDLVILDYQMPGMSGLEVLTRLRQSGLEVPVVVMTGGAGERVAVESLKLGAIDYVLKEDLPRLDWTRLIGRAVEMSRLRAEKKELERLNLVKNEFLELLAQDIKNPLATVFGALDMLLEERLGSLRSDQREAVETVQRETQRLYNLVEDLVNLRLLSLDYKDLARRRLPLRNVLVESVEAARRFLGEKAITLESSVPEDPLEMEGDPLRLRTIFDNVLSNAVQATPFGGRVGVLARRLPEGTAEILVADTGEGIGSAERARLFEKFLQSDRSFAKRFGGLGLGLALSRHLTEAHGGSLQIDSQGQGKGTVVTLRFPLTAPLSAQTPRA